MDQKILSEKATLVKDLNITDLIPTEIDGVIINIVDGRREIRLQDNINGEKFTTWKKRRGGIFYKDVFKYTRDQEHGKYVHVTGEDLDYIIRLIEEDELEDFEARRLVHGKIKDKPFMILYNNSELEELNEKDGYINENDQEDNITEHLMIVNPPNISPDDEEAGSAKSISLFD